MKITALIENRVSRSCLKAEHGLSYLIDNGEQTIVFDMGASNQFLQNAELLGFDLSKSHAAIISHGHNDHVGGLSSFIEANNSAPIFLKKETLNCKFKNEKSIGFDPKINSKNDRFVLVDDVTEIIPNIFIFPTTTIHFPVDQGKKHFFTQKDENIIPDNFDDELFLVLVNEGKLSVLSSCSHNGITNMIETARNYFKLPVKYVIGGFHLKNNEANNHNYIADYFNTIQVETVFTGHCTGVNAFAELKNKCTSPVIYLETGLEFSI